MPISIRRSSYACLARHTVGLCLALTGLVALPAACGKKQQASEPVTATAAASTPASTAPSSASTAPAVAAAPASAAPVASATTTAPSPSATKTAASGKKPALPKCAAGTSLVWADNESAKCLKSCDASTGKCPKGQDCVPGNETDDDGNPIQHDVVTVCLPKAAATKAGATAAPATLAAPAAGTMEVANPGNAACPTGYGNQGLLGSCNKSCKTNADCKKPFTCESLAGDPPHNCVDLNHQQRQ